MSGWFLPIMIGLHDEADKGVALLKDAKFGGYSLIICRLKKRQERGPELDEANCGRVICHLHFCKIEAARIFLRAVEDLVKKMEEDRP